MITAPYRIPPVRIGDMVGTETPLTCCGRTMTTFQPQPHTAATHTCVSCGARASVDNDGRISGITAAMTGTETPRG
ncbi:hypothetical protein ACKI1O_32095 [Streptomyces scabiei]